MPTRPNALIGRSEELDRLTQVRERAGKGERRVCVVVGPAGVGKSALLSRLDDPGNAWRQVAVRLPALRPMPASLVVDLVVSEVLRGLADDGQPVPPGLDPPAGTIATGHAATARLAGALGELGPLVLTIDDAQHAVGDPLERLLAIVRLMPSPACVLLGLRGSVDDAARGIPTSTDLPVEVLDLEELSDDGIARLLADVGGRPPVPSLVAAVQRIAQGNPLAARETLLTFTEAGEVTVESEFLVLTSDAPPSVPPTIGHLIASRLAALDDLESLIVDTLSVLDRPVSVTALVEICAQPVDEVVEAIGRLVERDLVSEVDRPPRTMLRHPLYGEHAIRSLSSSRRALIAARALTTVDPASAPAEAATLALAMLIPPPELRAWLFAAVEGAEASGDHRAVARWATELQRAEPTDIGRQQAAVRAVTATSQFEPADAIPVAARLADEALDAKVRVDSLLALATAKRLVGDVEGAGEALHDALTTDENDPRALASVAAHQLMVGDVAAAEPALEAAANAGRGTEIEWNARNNLAVLCLQRGDLRGAWAQFRDSHERCDNPGHRAVLSSNLASTSLLLGEWSLAESVASEGFELAVAAGDVLHTTGCALVLTELDLARDRLPEALDHALAARRSAATLVGASFDIAARAAVAAVLNACGHHADAIDVLGDVRTLADAAADKSGVVSAFVTLADAHIALRAGEEAERSLDDAERFAAAAPWTRQSIPRCRVDLLLLAPDPDTAIDIARRGLADVTISEHEQARLRFALGRALLADRQRAEAVAEVEAAARTAARIGAARLSTDCDTWLHEIADRPRTRPQRDPTSLTPRERQIGALVADELTNKQIAAELGISPGTVKRHLENLFRKTGAARRTQLAEHL